MEMIPPAQKRCMDLVHIFPVFSCYLLSDFCVKYYDYEFYNTGE